MEEDKFTILIYVLLGILLIAVVLAGIYCYFNNIPIKIRFIPIFI